MPTGNRYTWEISDPVTYVFSLRPSIVWHNGDPLLAEDIIFTHERAGSIAEHQLRARRRSTRWAGAGPENR